MTPQQFRLLIVVNQLLMVSLHVVAGMTDSMLPPELRGVDASSVFDTPLSVASGDSAPYFYTVVVDFLTFVAAAGLFFGRRWGRTLYLLCFLALVVSPLAPPYSTGTWWDGLFGYLYEATQGAVLALAYFSHLRRLYERREEEEEEEEG
ncbi:MAG TPA: hypothetical protein VEY09_01940 [Pyrinomonadaceae bacterium]|nr:hypothetical protein [Pyrinomonadaceae bacterium]